MSPYSIDDGGAVCPGSIGSGRKEDGLMRISSLEREDGWDYHEEDEREDQDQKEGNEREEWERQGRSGLHVCHISHAEPAERTTRTRRLWLSGKPHERIWRGTEVQHGGNWDHRNERECDKRYRTYDLKDMGRMIARRKRVGTIGNTHGCSERAQGEDKTTTRD